jgi:ribonuclease III
MRADAASLEVKIGYRFANPETLRRALIHSSHAHEVRSTPDEPIYDNQQLEFLGDAVLGFIVTDALVQRFPNRREGELSVLKAQLVSAAHLYGVARRLDLGAYLELGRSEEMTGGRTKKTLLADALEAMLAAMYLDGGIEPVRRFVTGHLLDAHFEGDRETDTDIQPAIANFKDALLELVRARKLPVPRYSVVREIGPPHSKTFTVEVSVGPNFTAQAEGRTKKIAAQRAARGVYERLLASRPAPDSEAAQ